LNFNNCVGGEEKRINTKEYNSLNQTVHPSPKAKTISLSTYTVKLNKYVEYIKPGNTGEGNEARKNYCI